MVPEGLYLQATGRPVLARLPFGGERKGSRKRQPPVWYRQSKFRSYRCLLGMYLGKGGWVRIAEVEC